MDSKIAKVTRKGQKHANYFRIFGIFCLIYPIMQKKLASFAISAAGFHACLSAWTPSSFPQGIPSAAQEQLPLYA